MRMSARALEVREEQTMPYYDDESSARRSPHRKHKRRIRQQRRSRRQSTGLFPNPSRTSSLLVWLAVVLASTSPWNHRDGAAVDAASAAESSTQEENAEVRQGARLFGHFVKLLGQSMYSNLYVASFQNKNSAGSGGDGKPKPLTMPTTNDGLPIMIARRRSLLETSVHQHYSHLMYHGFMAWDGRNNPQTDATTTTDERQQQQMQMQMQMREEIFQPLLQSMDAYLYQTHDDAYWKTRPFRRKSQAGVSSTANQVAGMPLYPPSMKAARRQQLRDMFYHAYNSYMAHAFPAAELKPLTCQPGTFELIRLPALTLMDTLDTLLILGDSLEFAKSVERLKQLHAKHTGGLFHVNQNVSVFETNIRVLGGLLSAHQLAVAYMATSTTEQQKAKSRRLPPVPLADVFHISEGEESEYLQMPDAVRIRLEQRDKQVHGGEEELVYNDATETCLLMDQPQKDRDDEDHNNKATANNWWEQHCGTSLLALEDCAVTATMKTRNQTAAKLHRSTRIIREPQADAERPTISIPPPEWEYDGFLLELALDMGERLLPAFDTKTGIPYGTVNLKYGVPEGETTIASLAGGGTLTLEMELLSRLTGDNRFGKAAKLATRALWTRRSPINLFGKHIDVHRGLWTETISGIGSNSDSFLEYLIKHYLLFPEDQDFWTMLQSSYEGIFQETRLGEWYADVEMKHGSGKSKGDGDSKRHHGMIRAVLESLMAFYPGMQLLLGEQIQAGRSLNAFFNVREYLGFLPERFSFGHWRVDGSASSGAARHPLRPELLESCYFMHRATMEETTANPTSNNATAKETSSSWLWAADFAITHLERVTRVKCGYGSVRGLNPAMGSVNAHQVPETTRLFNEMPSFFLSETVKYLFLTFDDDNILHTDPDREWIFTTEAHPIHHVPFIEEKEDNQNEAAQLEIVKDKLRNKLQHLNQQRNSKSGILARSSYAPRLSSDTTEITATYLTGEKWSDNTRPRDYKNDIHKVNQQIEDYEDDNLLENMQFDPENSVRLTSFFGNDSDLLQASSLQSADLFFEEFNNVAHMNLNDLGLGGGYALTKACPNLHASDLLWMRALNGGVLDYTDAYVSTVTDDDDEYPPSSSDDFIPILTAAEALSLHGSGVYLDSDLKSDRSPLVASDSEKQRSEGGESTTSAAKSSDSADAVSSDSDQEQTTAGVQQLQLDDLGLFEVSAFPGGSGFYMQHVDTGDSVTATFINDFPDDDNQSVVHEPYVMTYSVMPSRKENNLDNENGHEQNGASNNGEPEEADDDLGGGDGDGIEPKSKKRRWKDFASFFKKNKDDDRQSAGSHEHFLPKRSVVMADFSGNSFFCQIRLIKRPITVPTEKLGEAGSGDGNHDTILASYPCAPALFGPTHFSSLLGTDGIFIEQPIYAPSDLDEFGCNADVPTEASVDEQLSPASADGDLHVSSEDIAHSSDDGSCDSNGIQMVQRGFCNFQSKARNLKRKANAEAVIVINSDDEELFVMSPGEDNNLETDEIPPTVLVTGLDGEEILHHLELQNLEANNNDTQADSYLLAQLSLQRQEVPLTEGMPYPIVLGSPEALQILALGGWGIHAKRIEGDFTNKDGSGSNEMQLFMLRHNS